MIFKPLRPLANCARWTLLVALSSLLITARADTAGAQEAVQPFTASYEVTYRGLNAGTLHMQLQRADAPGRWTFETRAQPSMLARFVISSNALERSSLEIAPQAVKPLSWELDDGKSGDSKDGRLTFDWSAGKVTGRVERQNVELPTEARLQDRQSIQVEVMRALAQGEEPGTIPLIDDERVKHYTYTLAGTATLDTKIGKLETVVYESTRPGSSRVSKTWHAPSLGYLAVRAEQIRKGKVETVMVLSSVERN